MDLKEKKEQLWHLIEPVVESEGFELIELKYVPGKNGRLSLYIDREPGITIDNCEQVNGMVSDFLDQTDPISHSYNLEVSSPGLERPLRKREHFLKYSGEKVKIKTDKPIQGRRNFSGILNGIDGEMVRLKLEEGSVVDIPLAQIAKANLCYFK